MKNMRLKANDIYVSQTREKPFNFVIAKPVSHKKSRFFV
ncbi:hypothetical protein SAMN05192546_10727 [Tindallia californiensis]|uniref:Uncharacterized protein n=1 Tax=Tindallia californiensis TaxID=159292 RepID=A0A1H3PQM1_9FIRM|nr:hypothetical protein SAMN05192546_10727 [Tindallia californiensis]